nr:hypothetical protein GCM10020185_19940 [Pseudomonas brassicacearum subsp. brassicacearum]
MRDAIYLLTSRAQTQEVAQELVREMDWYDRYLAKGEADRSANTTPGNKKGGLSNIVEKNPWARSSNPAAARSMACWVRASASSKRA